MVTLSFIFYAIGCGLLIAAYFVTSTCLAWWLAGGALVALILGGIFQYKSKAKAIRNENDDNGKFNS